MGISKEQINEIVQKIINENKADADLLHQVFFDNMDNKMLTNDIGFIVLEGSYTLQELKLIYEMAYLIKEKSRE